MEMGTEKGGDGAGAWGALERELPQPSLISFHTPPKAGLESLYSCKDRLLPGRSLDSDIYRLALFTLHVPSQGVSSRTGHPHGGSLCSHGQ